MSQDQSSNPSEQSDNSPSIARSATVLALGNLASRLLGLLREITITNLFGATGEVSAFRIASTVPTMLFDLLIGGMLSAALVPVFSDYGRQARRNEIGEVFIAVLSVVMLLLSVLVLLLELLAPQVAMLLAPGFEVDNPELILLASQLIRIATPAVWFFACSGVVTALLYALKRFSYPAFGAAAYNLGIVLAAPLLKPYLGIQSLAVGVLLGSIFQLALQLPDLYQVGLRLRFDLSLRHHPALRRIWTLYLPVALGLVVSQVQIVLDRRLASATVEEALAWMGNATTLVQMPHGLISVAISLAALPTLSQFAREADWMAVRGVLRRVLRLILLLTIPATVGLWVLATPVVRLLFEHGAFTAFDTLQVAGALRFYLFGLIFVALSFPLNYTFYAYGNTKTPTLVALISVFVYTVVAFSLQEPIGFLGLVLADSAKHATHAIIMLGLTFYYLGAFIDHDLIKMLIKVTLATFIMHLLMLWLLPGVESRFLSESLTDKALIVGITSAAGLSVYLIALWLMRSDELVLFVRKVVGVARGGRRFG